MSSGIDWIAPDGSDRRSVVKGPWQITSAPRALKIPIRKAGYEFGDPSESDSLFVLGMADGTRTFIASYPSSFGNGLILSPDGSYVIYHSAGDPQTRASTLRIARADGTDSRILVHDGLRDSPSFSPDGRRIAYARFDGITTRLRVIDLESGADVAIADTLSTFGFTGVSWSANGDHIAFSRKTADDSITLWSIGITGIGLRRLTPEGQQDILPRWSPAGSLLVCTGRESPTGQRLIVMNGDGTERRILTGTQETILTDPQWSPDGGRIIYRSGNSLRTLKVVDIESGAVKVLAVDLYGRAFWDLGP